MRIEHDFLGELQVPDDAYYGVQTMRAIRLPDSIWIRISLKLSPQ